VLSELLSVRASWLHHCKANAKVVLSDRWMVVRNDARRTFLACLAEWHAGNLVFREADV
jgi:hypothetical protein